MKENHVNCQLEIIHNYIREDLESLSVAQRHFLLSTKIQRNSVFVITGVLLWRKQGVMKHVAISAIFKIISVFF